VKIVHISTADIEGGAARAAYRLHKGLQEIGEESLMLVRDKACIEDSVLEILPDSGSESSGDEELSNESVIQNYYIDANRTKLSDTVFSFPYPGYELCDLPEVQRSDIINFHWIARFQSPVTLQRVLALGKPVVWTLHDQWAFTGGCHFSAGCEKYRSDCQGCPQLGEDPFDLPAAVLCDKVECFQEGNLTIVSPSRWLAECAKASWLFRKYRVEVIPYSLDSTVFRPVPRAEAKASLGLVAESIVLLFGSMSSTEKRKGFELTAAALGRCLKDRRFKQMVDSGHLEVMCFGFPGDGLKSVGMPVFSLGYIRDDEKMNLAYAAADAFILPSLEDNLPNTMLESMSCGTPVIGSRVGGIPDLVREGVTGRLVAPDDEQQLAEAILSVTTNPERFEVMGRNCRRLIEKEYSATVQAQRYLRLYEELCEAGGQLGSLDRKSGTIFSSREEPGKAGGKTQHQAYVQTAMGAHFSTIYQPILIDALKNFVLDLHKRHNIIEADRDAMREQLRASQEQLRASQEQLATGESDRAVKAQHIESLQQMLNYLSTVRGAISNLIAISSRKLRLYPVLKRCKRLVLKLISG
jgi:glycosyltransferase involved in cell wall biosynthesis